MIKKIQGVVLGLSCAAVLPAGAAIVVDGGFEASQKAANFYYAPTDFPNWTFASNAGVIHPASAFNGPTTPADGTQYAFLQNYSVDAATAAGAGTITQSVTIPTDGVYKFSLQSAARQTIGAGRYEWLIDGVNIGGVQTANTLGTFGANSFTYGVKAGNHTLTLRAIGPAVGPTDSTTFIDAVAITQAPNATAGSFTRALFTGDADSGISSSKTYTHAVSFNGPDTVINGVTFKGGGLTGTNYTLTTTGGTFTGNANNLTGASNDLAKTFFYNGTETLTLTGLEVGKTYATTFYNVAFGAAGGRVVTVTDSQGGEIINFDENFSGDKNGNLLQDTYTAADTSITFTFTPTGAGSFHQYGFSNELVQAPEPATIGLAGVALIGALARRRRA